MKRLMYAIFILMVFLISPTCSAAPGDPPAQADAPEEVYGDAPIPTELVAPLGTLKVGDPIDNALKILGAPLKITGNQNYCWRDKIDIYGPELVIKTTLKKEMYGFYVRKWAAASTPEGIRVGSTREQVLATYGKPREAKKKDLLLYYGGGKPGAPYLRFGISTKTKKVIYFWLGTQQEPPHQP